MNNFRYLKGDCPVCGGARKDCRENLTNHMIHCRHDADPVGFVFRGHDAQGFGLWLPSAIADEQSEEKRKEWIESQRREREAREAVEQQRRTEGLSEVQRDRQFRNLLGQLSLSPKHYEDLKRRGLTDEQIRSGMFVSVRKWQRLDQSISHLLPGVDIDGRSLNIAYPGYLCPIWHNGLIVGCQIRTEQSEGKYRWLTSVNRKRPNGQTSHLKNGELPISVVEVSGDQDLRFAEGILKPYVAAYRLNKNFIGAAGGNFASSPQQVEDAIASLNPERLILCPDAGAVNNSQVMRSYKALYELVSSLGHELWVEWWGQFDKSSPDIDELSPGIQTQIISYGDFLKLSPFKSAVQQAYKSNQISRSEWIKQYKLPGEISSFAQTIQKQYNRAVNWSKKTKKEKNVDYPEATAPVNTSAIVLYRPESIPYIKGQLLTKEEWLSIGCPKIVYKSCDREDCWAEISTVWKYGHDSSGAGLGKTHTAGEMTLEKWGIIDDPKDKHPARIFFKSSSYRNPSTVTIEDRFDELIARHEGLDLDESRQTPSGDAYRVRHNPKSNSAPEIAPPCIEVKAFRAFADKGRVVFGGEESPVCQTCSHLPNCGFLKQRRETLGKSRYIRADINGMSTPSHKDIGITDEAGSYIKPTVKQDVTPDEIGKAATRLFILTSEDLDYNFYRMVYPIFQKIYQAVVGLDVQNKKHGDDHQAVVDALPSQDELEKGILEYYWDDWINPDSDPWGNPIETLSVIRHEDGTVTEKYKTVGYKAPAPSLIELAAECEEIIYKGSAHIFNSSHTPEEKANLIQQQVLPSFIPDLLRAIGGDKRYALSIKPSKAGNILRISKPYHRHRNIIKSSGFELMLDATLTKEDLSLNLGTHPNEIIEVCQEPSNYSNLTINCIRGIKGGRDRIISQKINGKYQKVESENSQESRLKYAIHKIVSDHADDLIGLIDHQKFVKDGSYSEMLDNGFIEKSGYWFNESRGSNQFKELQHLIVVGRPTQNLGDLAAEWQSLSGQVKTPTDLSGRYGAWARRKERSELNQAIGRLRANLRPTEQLTAWMINDLSDDDIKAIKAKYPGVKVNVVQAYDICPEAAPKGTRKIRGIIEAVYEGVSAGINVTVKDLATQLNTVHSNISNTVKRLLGIGFKALKKMLQSLFKAINRKCDISISKTLNSDEIWIAKTYLPMVWEQIQKANDPVLAAEELNSVAQSFGWQSLEAILGTTDPSTLTGLLKSIIRCLPVEIHEQLNLSPG